MRAGVHPGGGRWPAIGWALLLLGFLAQVDRALVGLGQGPSARVSMLDLHAGGDASLESKIVVRRDHLQKVLALVVDPSNPLLLTPEELEFLGRELEAFEQLLAQGLWSSCRLLEALPPERLESLGRRRQDPTVVHTAMRSESRWLVEQLEAAFGATADAAARTRPPAGWAPEVDEPELWSRWRAWLEEDRGFIPGSDLLDFHPGAVALALALDRRERPSDGQTDLEVLGHACQMLLSLTELDRRWNLIESLLRQGGPQRAGLLPRLSDQLLPPEQWNDLPIQELLRAVREARGALGQVQAGGDGAGALPWSPP